MPDLPKQEVDVSPSGIDFVFEMGMKKIEEQLREIEALDVKIGILFGFLGTVLVALLALAFTVEQSTAQNLAAWPSRFFLFLGVSFTGLALYNAFRAFRLRQYYGTPQFSDLIRWANEDPKRTKLVFVYTLLEAVDRNIKRLENKQLYANHATWCVFLAFLSFLFAIIGIGVKLLLPR